ncbi:sensor histidine kinase [Patulibacter minatonensis]|uniref:sensor histidine kinase n=1 Tax=Patulibacter minatonensis TaxID=298163 RepID=UPI00047B3F7F|nr:ATP-binding protein [Patulibacter minatonensis]
MPPASREPRAPRRPPGTASAVLRFMAGSLAAVLVIVVGGFFALRTVTLDEAKRDTKERVIGEGRLVQFAGLSDGLLRGDPKAIAKLDDVVQSQILGRSIVRVKVWTRDARILYSDEPRLIGRRFTLGDEEQELFTTGGAEAELSDLSEPENVYERPQGELLEAHTRVRLPDGTPVLFEIYQRFSSVTASGERILGTLAPPLIGGLVVLLLFQVPLAWSLARRLRRGHEEREGLLTAAIDASSQERRRIAADLHDGAVQDLAGVAFGLAPLAEEARRAGDAERASALDDSVGRLRQGVRDLRTLLVQIHPPTVAATGLHAALTDLLSPLHAAGIATELEVDDAVAAGTRHDELLYRAAREAVRNAREHASPSTVRVHARTTDAGGVSLVVADDGSGSTPAQRQGRRAEGHLGLQLIDDLVRQAGGTSTLDSVPGRGTTLTLELPA